MKFIVKDGRKSDDSTLTLFLDQEEETVTLMAEDEGGDPWELLRLHEDGSSVLLCGLANDIGFNVDEDGHLAVTKETEEEE